MRSSNRRYSCPMNALAFTAPPNSSEWPSTMRAETPTKVFKGQSYLELLVALDVSEMPKVIMECQV